MKFVLNDRIVNYGSVGESSIFYLPDGPYEVSINTMSGINNRKCDFLGEKCATVLLNIGFPGLNCSGDIIVTCSKMGYDLSKKEDLKKIKKEDKDLVISKYHELMESDPDLFDVSKIDWLKTKAPFWKLETGDKSSTWVSERESDIIAADRWTNTSTKDNF